MRDALGDGTHRVGRRRQEQRTSCDSASSPKGGGEAHLGTHRIMLSSTSGFTRARTGPTTAGHAAAHGAALGTDVGVRGRSLSTRGVGRVRVVSHSRVGARDSDGPAVRSEP